MGEIICLNQNLHQVETDHLFHLGISKSDPVVAEFTDTKFVILGGSANRILFLAKSLSRKLLNSNSEPKNYAADGGRYSLYKVGPVICINHNIGGATLSVVLHEISKLLYHAKAMPDVHFIRIGTCGGIGVSGGSVVCTTGVVDAQLRDEFHWVSCGVEKTWPMKIDSSLASEISQVAQDLGIFSVLGKTMATEDFYLGQARLDGYFCDYTLEDKTQFLNKLHDSGVRNIEMESHILSAFCYKAGFRCSVVCVSFLDRLLGDQHYHSVEEMKIWENYPVQVVVEYVSRKISTLV